MEALITKNINNGESVINDILKGAIPSNIKSKSRVSGNSGIMSIVKAKTGNRISIGKEVMEKLNNPEKVKIAFRDDSVIIGENLANNSSSLNIKKSGAKGIIYSIQLVGEMAKLFNLDFSDRTSITFEDVEYIVDEDYPVAIVKIK